MRRTLAFIAVTLLAAGCAKHAPQSSVDARAFVDLDADPVAQY